MLVDHFATAVPIHINPTKFCLGIFDDGFDTRLSPNLRGLYQPNELGAFIRVLGVKHSCGQSVQFLQRIDGRPVHELQGQCTKVAAHVKISVSICLVTRADS